MTIDPRTLADYRAERALGMSASRAHAIVKHVREVRSFERDYVTEDEAGNDTRLIIVHNGLTYSVAVEPDDVVGPEDYDCYEDEDIRAYERGDWSYVHITVTVRVDGFKGTDSLGAVDVGEHWRSVSRLDATQQVISAVLDNEMLDSACHAALRARAEADREYIRRQIAKIRNGEDDDSYRLRITSDKGSTKWLTITRDQLFSVAAALGIDAREDNGS